MHFLANHIIDEFPHQVFSCRPFTRFGFYQNDVAIRLWEVIFLRSDLEQVGYSGLGAIAFFMAWMRDCKGKRLQSTHLQSQALLTPKVPTQKYAPSEPALAPFGPVSTNITIGEPQI